MLSSICIWPGLAEHIYYILCDIGNVRVRLRLGLYVCVCHTWQHVCILYGYCRILYGMLIFLDILWKWQFRICKCELTHTYTERSFYVTSHTLCTYITCFSLHFLAHSHSYYIVHVIYGRYTLYRSNFLLHHCSTFTCHFESIPLDCCD